MAIALALAGCKRQGTRPPPPTQPAPGAAPEAFTDVIALNNRGVGFMGRFEYEMARQAFEQAATIDADNADLKVNLAIATLNRQREGDEQRALTILDEALRLDSNNLRAEYCKGLLRLYLQSPQEAQPHFKKVVDADARDAFAAYYLGQCLAQQKHYDQALEQYRIAIELDPHIRSAFYAASQAYRASGDDANAAKMLAEFQALERNPQAHLAEFKYTRMGPKSMARTIDASASPAAAASRPEGPIFLDPEPLLTNGDQFKWKVGADGTDRATSITGCDIDSDGDIDIFIANCLDQGDVYNAVCINDGMGRFEMDVDHALAKIPNVNAVLWGDIDNDGLTDVYLCRRGANMLWRQTAQNVWTDVTVSTQTANGELDSVDGALFDADHDGDLDIFVVNADGLNELLNNNLDGTFKPIAAEAGIAGNGKGSRQVLPVDLDGDRDLDLIVVNDQPPHDVWTNERAWKYERTNGYDWLKMGPITGILAADADANGDAEPYLLADDSGLVRLHRNDLGGWTNEGAGRTGPAPVHGKWFTVADPVGDGRLRGLLFSPAAWSIVDLTTGLAEEMMQVEHSLAGAALAVLSARSGPSMVAAVDGAQPVIRRPGPGRLPFASVALAGKQVTSDNKQVRSNASGIGTQFAARIDSHWIAGDTMRHSSSPGQSLQPVSIGLGGADQIDFLAINWSDGVFQTELELEAGKHHIIQETQRQLSSCPVLFAWDGERYRFITDLLGVGGIGYMTAPGEYAPSRPWENLLLPADAIQPRDGQYILKLDEPMEEACYVDAARLIAYDLPPGWNMTVDDRMNIAGPEPTGAPMFYQTASLRGPLRAVNDRGDDITDSLRTSDLIPAPVGEIDERFIGRLRDERVIELQFDASDASRGKPVLLIDGWIEYPYSQTMFAAWQANAAYRAPTLEMRDTTGEWRTVYEQFGYPAGMPRQMALPLPVARDASGPIQVRIRTNQEIYFDSIALIETEHRPDVRRIDLPLAGATLADVGFAHRTTGPRRQPSYDYDRRTPLWDTRHQRGWYTAFGRVDELVAREDDALAIFGPGEEIELRFEATALPPIQPGWTRRFVLEARGWCKDMDLYTQDGDTLEPLPAASPPHDQTLRDALHRRLNTRYMSGH